MFIVQPDKTIMDRIYFCDLAGIPKNLDNYLKQFYQLPDILTLPIQLDENTVLPDIFLKPYPMVSDMVMQVMKMYRAEMFSRRVVLTVKNSKEYKRYFLLYIDEKTVSLFRDFELKRDSKETIKCTISLDFAESILRRDAKGIKLVEEKGADTK